jgi:hypothetical protein
MHTHSIDNSGVGIFLVSGLIKRAKEHFHVIGSHGNECISAAPRARKGAKAKAKPTD